MRILRYSQLVWRALLMLLSAVLTFSLVVFLIRTSAQTPPANSKPDGSAYKLADGPNAFEIIDHTIQDAERKKDLPVRILAPKSAGPFPLIIFSHGAEGSGQNYFPLTGHWVTHGYVVIQPTHADSISLRRDQGETLPGSPRELVEDYRFNYEDWINRVRDITLVLDSIGDLEKRLPQLRGKIDPKRIGMSGHSYGAFTTQMIGGALLDIPNGPKAQSFSDERPRALLLLSPQGKTQNGLTETSWKAMTRPTMSMTGSNDRGVMGQPVSWREDPYTYSPPGDKYLVFIEGAFHMSFTGMLLQSPNRLHNRPVISRMISRTDQKAVFDYVKVATIAFWDAYLKADPKANAYLKSDALVEYSNKSVRLDRK